MEISDIKKKMRKDLSENKLNALQKQIFEDRPAEFLFDIENNLCETKNLTNNLKYKTVLEKMRNQSKSEILNSRDVMLFPEYEIALITKTTTPYEFLLDNKKYPIEEIYKAASLSGFRGKDIKAKQINLLDNSEIIVRYWAMIGLLAQSSEDLKPYSNVIIKAMNDNYPPVAITAAAIAYQEFNNKLAEENLKEFCLNKNNDLALMAINYLLYVKNKQPFIEIIQSVRKMKGASYNVKAVCLDFLGSLELIPNVLDYE